MESYNNKRAANEMAPGIPIFRTASEYGTKVGLSLGYLSLILVTVAFLVGMLTDIRNGFIILG